MDVTAVLLNYARPYNTDRIVRALAREPAVKQVVVWNNGAAAPIAIPHDRGASWLVWVNSPWNIFTMGRFVAAVKYAKHDAIWLQDDDIINPQLADLLRIAEQRRTDRAIVAALPDDESSAHFLWYQVNEPPETELGFGAVIDRRWIAPCFAAWRRRFPGEDYLACRKADKIFTVLHGRRVVVKTPVERLKGPDGKESGRDAHALWLRADHKRLNEEVVAKCLKIREEMAARAQKTSGLAARS